MKITLLLLCLVILSRVWVTLFIITVCSFIIITCLCDSCKLGDSAKINTYISYTTMTRHRRHYCQLLCYMLPPGELLRTTTFIFLLTQLPQSKVVELEIILPNISGRHHTVLYDTTLTQIRHVYNITNMCMKTHAEYWPKYLSCIRLSTNSSHYYIAVVSKL